MNKETINEVFQLLGLETNEERKKFDYSKWSNKDKVPSSSDTIEETISTNNSSNVKKLKSNGLLASNIERNKGSR